MQETEYPTIEVILSEEDKHHLIVHFIKSHFSGASICVFRTALGDGTYIQRALYDTVLNECIVDVLTTISEQNKADDSSEQQEGASDLPLTADKIDQMAEAMTEGIDIITHLLSEKALNAITLFMDNAAQITEAINKSKTKRTNNDT